jgi:Methylamine utilisation protein MauE
MGGFTLVETIQVLAAQLAAFEALLLIASAAHKAANWASSQNVVQRFAGVPASLAAWGLAGAVSGELVAGVLLVVPAYRAAGAMLAALMWCAYLALILRAIVQGRRDVDCGCSFGSTPRSLGSFHVARNAVLLGFAVFVAAGSAVSGSVPVQGSQALAACALLALYAALDQVMALQPLRSGEVL